MKFLIERKVEVKEDGTILHHPCTLKEVSDEIGQLMINQHIKSDMMKIDGVRYFIESWVFNG